MKAHSDETAALRPEVAAKVAQHYAHARAKHPYFADFLFLRENDKVDCQKTLSGYRSLLDLSKGIGIVYADTVLNCEICEAAYAFATGEEAEAVEECYDAIAVLLRVVDVIEGRQPLGDPKRGKREKKGAAE